MFLASAIATTKHGSPEVVDIIIVCDFTYVLLDEVSSLPLARGVECAIDLVLNTTPISKVHYHMATFELRELKEQLQDLLD